MRIFINDQMSDTPPTPQILARFERRQLSALAIGDADAGYCRAEWDEPQSCMLHLLQKEMLSGVRLPKKELHQVRAAFQEFFQGFKPKLPTRHLAKIPRPEVQHVRLGTDYEDDCPLCRMEAGKD